MGPIVQDVLGMAYTEVWARIFTHEGDAIIGNNGNVQWATAQGLTFRTWNTNNHQLTYGVLAAAMVALCSFMEGTSFGTVKFTIYDGDHEVAAGALR